MDQLSMATAPIGELVGLFEAGAEASIGAVRARIRDEASDAIGAHCLWESPHVGAEERTRAPHRVAGAPAGLVAPTTAGRVGVQVAWSSPDCWR
jgi:hypothetical protein